MIMQIRTAFLIGLSIILLICPLVSATYEVIQGDTLYLGETVDISRVMSWSGQFAYFNNGEPGDYPAKIIDVNDVGHMYNYYIDPNKYIVGTWYKWDGKDERAGNMLAFTIAPGIRNNTYISQLNPETTPAPFPNQTVMTMPAKIPQETHLLLARGDTGSLHYGLPYNQTNGVKQQGYMWLFGNAPDYTLTKTNLMTKGTLMGIPMNYTSNDSVHSFTFTPETSRTLQEGWYSGYMQFSGINGKQDVFYNLEKNQLDSIYKGIDPVKLDGFIPTRIQQEFQILEQPSEYTDDILVPISVEVVTPSLTIGDYWEDADNITIQGSTPMSEGTIITVIIDPDNYALLPEIRAHTYRTTAQYKIMNNVVMKEADCVTTVTNLNNDGFNATMYNGTAYNVTFANGTTINGIQLGNPTSSKTLCTSIPRIYTIRIPIKWSEMAIGRHTIHASIDTYGIKAETNKDFLITGEWVNPTPTKEFNKLIVVKQGSSPRINISSRENEDSGEFPNQTIITPEITQPADIIIIINQSEGNPAPPVQTPKSPASAPESQGSNPFLWLAVIGMIIAVFIGWLYWG